MTIRYEKDMSGDFISKITETDGKLYLEYPIDENDPGLLQWLDEGNVMVDKSIPDPSEPLPAS